MKLLLPIFIADAELDWTAPPLSGLLAERLVMVRDQASAADVRVFTDSDHVAALAAALSLPCAKTQAPPPGPLHARALALPGIDGISSDEPLLVLDFRTVTVTGSDIQLARTAFEENPAEPVISMEKPRDNPVQFRTTYTVLDSGVLHLLASEDAVADLRERLRLPVAAASRAFPARAGMGGLEPGDGVLTVREDADSARIVWLNQPPAGSASIIAVSARREGVVRVSENGNGCVLDVSAPPMSVLSLVPFSRTGIVAEFPETLPLERGSVALPVPEGAVSGYLYTVESHVGSGAYAASTPHVPSLACKARVVTGRQDFPDIFRFDEALCLGTRRQLLELDERMASGRVQRLPNASRESIRVLTFLDVLRHEVWQAGRDGLRDGAA